MTSLKIISVFGAGLVLTGLPLVTASAESPVARPLGYTDAPLYSGRSVSRRHKRSYGSFTNGKPDGANTGNRKQTPTGGNPGSPNHS